MNVYQPDTTDPYAEYDLGDGTETKEEKYTRAAPASFAERDSYLNVQNINDPSQQEHDGVFSKRIRLRFLRDFVESVSKIPSYFPKNFYQQFKLQFFDDKNRLYIYDYINRRWVWAQLNIDEYETTQITMPSSFASPGSTDFGGWDNYFGYGADTDAFYVANGSVLSSPSGNGYAFTNSFIGYVGGLDWDSQKNVRYELTGVPTSVAAGTKNGFGFIDINTPPGPNPLAPVDSVNRTTTDRCIAFMSEGTALYAVCGDGTLNHNELVPGITLATNVTHRFKFLWDPVAGTVKFYVNDTLTNTISAAVPKTTGVKGLFGFFGTTETGGGNGFSFTFPKLGIQIN